ncbi:MAG: preprotein translocase subunit SecG [Nitrospinae bacterium]|nr:preprotein translocase subunit SecG [Nitrospinota bacterium]
MLYGLVVAAHLLVALILIIIVLLQQGKGAAMGASFGGSSQTIFGSRGPASALAKVTTGAAIVFMFTSIALSMMSNTSVESSVMPAGSEPAQLPVDLPAQVPASEATKNTPAPVGAVHESGGPQEQSAGSKPEAIGPVDAGKVGGKTGG